MFTSWTNLAAHHTQDRDEENFSALTLSLLIAGDVLSWHGKVDCSIASWTEWHCLHSLSTSIPHSSSSSSTGSLPLLFIARLLAAQTAQLSSVPPLPQQILHELCVSEWDGTFKGERSVQGQCVCVHILSPPSSPPILISNSSSASLGNHQCKGFLVRETPHRCTLNSSFPHSCYLIAVKSEMQQKRTSAERR